MKQSRLEKTIGYMAGWAAILILLSGCARVSSVEWLSVDGVQIQETEVMLYMVQTYQDFEQLGGKDVWSLEDFSGGKSAVEVARQGAFDNLIRNQILSERAEAMGFDLSESETGRLASAADAYYEGLPASFVSAYGLELTDILSAVTKSYLADQVKEATMKDYKADPAEVEAEMLMNREYQRFSKLSAEDILTGYRVHHLVISTHRRLAKGEWEILEADGLEEAETRLQAARTALAEEVAFEEIVLNWSDLDKDFDPEGELISKAQLPEGYRDALDDLEIGAHTEIIEGEYGWHCFYLIDKTVPDKEDLKAFTDQYDQWVSELEADAVRRLKDIAFDGIYTNWLEGADLVYGPAAEAFDFNGIIELGKSID